MYKPLIGLMQQSLVEGGDIERKAKVPWLKVVLWRRNFFLCTVQVVWTCTEGKLWVAFCYSWDPSGHNSVLELLLCTSCMKGCIFSQQKFCSKHINKWDLL